MVPAHLTLETSADRKVDHCSERGHVSTCICLEEDTYSACIEKESEGMLIEKEVAGDIVAAATGLAGLMLVFMGTIANGFGSYNSSQQDAIRRSYRRKIWFSFSGFFASIISAALALISKGFECADLLNYSMGALFAALAIATIAAILSALEIG